MKKTFFILALLTSGFLLAANAYGEGADGKLGVWNEERALALGMPLLPIGIIILCESEKVVGCNWANGKAYFQFPNSVLQSSGGSHEPLAHLKAQNTLPSLGKIMSSGSSLSYRSMT